MMLSKRSKYGLRAILALARHPSRQPVLIAALAQQERIPKKFLEQILLALKHAGLLGSKKGQGGGYFLQRAPDAISLGDVIRALDGPIAPVPCVSRMAHHPCEDCEDEATCGVRDIMQQVRAATASILDQTTLAEVLRRTDEMCRQRQRVLTYSI